MKNFKIEYLITLDQKKPFCNSVDSFKNLFEMIDETVVEDAVIKYKSLEINYKIQTSKIAEDEHDYFHLRFDFNDENNRD